MSILIYIFSFFRQNNLEFKIKIECVGKSIIYIYIDLILLLQLTIPIVKGRACYYLVIKYIWPWLDAHLFELGPITWTENVCIFIKVYMFIHLGRIDPKSTWEASNKCWTTRPRLMNHEPTRSYFYHTPFNLVISDMGPTQRGGCLALAIK